MGFDEFRIILDTSSSHIYHPGELVVGQVHLKVLSDIDLSIGIRHASLYLDMAMSIGRKLHKVIVYIKYINIATMTPQKCK